MNINLINLKNDSPKQMNIFQEEIEKMGKLHIEEIGTQIIPILQFDIKNIKNKGEKTFLKTKIKNDNFNILTNFLSSINIDIYFNNNLIGFFNIKNIKENYFNAEIIRHKTSYTVLITTNEQLKHLLKEEIKKEKSEIFIPYQNTESLIDKEKILNNIKLINLIEVKEEQEQELIKHIEKNIKNDKLNEEEKNLVKENIKQELIKNLKVKIITNTNIEEYISQPYIYNLLLSLKQDYQLIVLKEKKENQLNIFFNTKNEIKKENTL